MNTRTQRTFLSSLLSLFVAIMVAMGVVTFGPGRVTAQAASTPVTITVHFVFGSQTAAPASSFPTKADLDYVVQAASDYWARVTNGAIRQVRYDWNAIRTIDIPADATASSSDFELAAAAIAPQFPQVPADMLPAYLESNPNGDIVAVVEPADEFTRRHGNVGGFGGGSGPCPGYGHVCGSMGLPTGMTAQSLAHEMGHCLGLGHMNFMSCAGTAKDPGPTYGSECLLHTYEDYESIMAGQPRSLALLSGLSVLQASGFERSQLGLLADGSGRTTLRTAGVYQQTLNVLDARSTTNQELRILDPSSPYAEYSLELRPAGTLDWMGDPIATGGVAVMRVDTVSSPAAREARWPVGISDSVRLALPGADGLLHQGESFTSFDGAVRIQVTALSATQASLTVTLSGSGRMTPVISGPTVIDVPATGAGARGLSPVSATFTATGVTSVRAIALDSWAGASASVSPGSLRLSLDVAPNLTASPRSTQVAVSAPGMQEPVFVMLRQAAGGSNPISVSLPSWSAPGAGGTQPVQVNTSGVWEVSTPDWITASPGFGSGGTQVTLKAAPNTSGADRSATVLFVAGGRWASVVVSQSAQVAAGDDCGNTPSTACSWPDLGVPVSGRIETLGDTDWFRIVVPVPGQWSFTYTRPAVDPIASSVGTVYWDQKNGRPPASIASDFYSAGDSQFRVKANLQAGETYYLEVSSSRAALVTGNYMVTAIPPGGSVPPSLSASSWNPAAAGGSTSVQVWASGDWSVTWPLWVTASRSSGSGNGSVDLTASANTGTAARSWTATFTSGALSATFTITQAAGVVPQLTLSQTTWSAPAGGGDVPVDVTSNVAWQVTTTAGVSVSQSSGSGNGRVTVTASPNPGTASRTMTVTFTGGGMTARLDISQVGQVASLSLSASSWGPAPGGGSTSLQVWASGDWSVSWPSWVKASRSSGSGNATVDLTADPNTGTLARLFPVQFTSGNLVATFLIFQLMAPQGPQLSLSRSTVSVPPEGGVVTVDVTSNVTWQVSATGGLWPDTWSGSGNGQVTVKVGANTSGVTQSLWVRFTGGGLTVTLDITQVAPVVSLSLSASSWGPEPGGGSTSLEVLASGDWSVSWPSWVKASRSSGSGNATIDLTAAPNTGTMFRFSAAQFTSGNQVVTFWIIQQAAS